MSLNLLFGEARCLVSQMKEGKSQYEVIAALEQIIRKGEEENGEQFEEILLPYLLEQFPMQKICISSSASMYMANYRHSAIRHWVNNIRFEALLPWRPRDYLAISRAKYELNILGTALPHKCVLDFYSHIEDWAAMLKDTTGMLKQEVGSSLILFRCLDEWDMAAVVVFINTEMESFHEKSGISNYHFRIDEKVQDATYRYNAMIARVDKEITSSHFPSAGKPYYEFEIDLKQ